MVRGAAPCRSQSRPIGLSVRHAPDKLATRRLGLASSATVSGSRVVVITGGSSGIGRATAALFSRQGWRVGVIARGQPGLDAAQQDLAATGAALALAADVSRDDELEQAADRMERELGPIAVWINCAGNGVYGRFSDVPAAQFQRCTEVTYMGTVNGTRAALRHMRPRDTGTIVNVCSAIAFRGMPLLSSYSGAKQAVRGFTEAVRGELLQDRSGVHITLVYPPAVNTPFFSHAETHMHLPPRPMRPVYQPELVAEGIYRAATSRRREVQVGGTTVAFGLANRLVPGLVDMAISRLGYAGQMIDCPDVRRLRNPTMFTPSCTAAGTRGPFGATTKRFSLHMWATRHAGKLAAGFGAGVVVLAGLLLI